ncbi:MAG: 50S ribosomal protein L35 [Candidatus Latescibacterota bacterium]|nr:MAG: 50S ribosomal protein L35 [Candidatus Latescibacterota bacterium]
MPKIKTSRGARKRFRVTGGGKLMRMRAFKTHILTKKTTKRKRNLRKPVAVSPANQRQVRRLLVK